MPWDNIAAVDAYYQFDRFFSLIDELRWRRGVSSRRRSPRFDHVLRGIEIEKSMRTASQRTFRIFAY